MNENGYRYSVDRERRGRGRMVWCGYQKFLRFFAGVCVSQVFLRS